jgi:hypothetical protein
MREGAGKYLFFAEHGDDMLLMVEPNVAEGQDRRVIDEVRDALRGPYLLREEVSEKHNRSAFLLLGEEEELQEALRRLYEYGKTRDVSMAYGAYPRIGFVDVVPVYPLPGRDIGPAVNFALRVAEMAAEMGYPVYLCGEAARRDGRRTPWDVRNGHMQWEDLRERMADEIHAPDMGPREMPPFGATVVYVSRYPLKLVVEVAGETATLVARLREIDGLSVGADDGEVSLRYTGSLSPGTLLSVIRREADALGLQVRCIRPAGPFTALQLVRETSASLRMPLSERDLVEWAALNYLLSRGRQDSEP